MSRSYAPTELKRRLKPGPGGAGAARVPGAAQRPRSGTRTSAGAWRIILIRARAGAARAARRPSEVSGPGRGADEPRGHGEDGRRAGAAHPGGRIRTKLEVFDWLVRNEDKRRRQEPGRLPRGLDPGRLPGPRRLPARPTPRPAPAATRQRRRGGRAADGPGRAETRPTAPRPARPSSAPPGRRCPTAEREAILRPSRPRTPA